VQTTLKHSFTTLAIFTAINMNQAETIYTGQVTSDTDFNKQNVSRDRESGSI